MPEYRSQPGGLFNSGVFADSRPRIDVGGILDAVGGGIGSVIHQTMVRKQAENEAALRRQQVGIEQQRATTEAANQERDFGLRQEAERHRALEAGIIPAHTDLTNVAGQSAVTPLNPVAPSAASPLRRAMTAGAPGAPLSVAPSATDMSVQVTPSNAPASTGPGDTVNANPAPAAPAGSVQSDTPTLTTTPETFDPTKSLTYQRLLGGIDARGGVQQNLLGQKLDQQRQLQAERLAAQQNGREFAASAAKSLAEWKQAHPTPKSAVGRTMTENAQSTLNQKVAAGYLEQHQGNLQDAVDGLENTPEGQALAAQGVTKAHLLAAYGSSNPATTRSVLRLQTGPDGMKPEAAVDAVQKTRKLVSAGNKAAPADDFTDDEIADAMKAGKTKPEDLRAYVAQQRTKKKAPK